MRKITLVKIVDTNESRNREKNNHRKGIQHILFTIWSSLSLCTLTCTSSQHYLVKKITYCVIHENCNWSTHIDYA